MQYSKIISVLPGITPLAYNGLWKRQNSQNLDFESAYKKDSLISQNLNVNGIVKLTIHMEGGIKISFFLNWV